MPVLTPAAARHRELDFAIFVLSSNFPSPSEPALDNLFPHGVAAGLPDPRQCQVEDAEAILARTRATAAFVTIGVDPRSAQPIPQSTFVARLESLLGSTTIREPFAAHDPRACAQRTPTRCRATLAAMKIAAAAAPAQRSITRDSGFEVPQEVDVWDFLDFFKNPHRAFFRARGLWIPEFEPPLPPRAAEEPGYLDRSTVRRGIHGRLLELQKSGVAPILTKQMRDAHFAHICAEGFIAPSAAGREWFDAQASVMEDFTRRVRTGTTVVPIDLTVGYSLDGAARSLRIHGSAPCQNSTIVVERIGSATNEVLLSTVALEALLAEAGLNLGWRVVCIESDAVKERTVGDRKFRTTPIPLDSLARLWAVGLRRPIPLFATALRDHGRTNWASHDPRFIAWASEALHSPDGTERPTLDASARLLDAASILSLTWDSAIDAPATTGLSDFERITRLFDAANTADDTIADSVR